MKNAKAQRAQRTLRFFGVYSQPYLRPILTIIFATFAFFASLRYILAVFASFAPLRYTLGVFASSASLRYTHCDLRVKPTFCIHTGVSLWQC
jgi:hypothetical protein